MLYIHFDERRLGKVCHPFGATPHPKEMERIAQERARAKEIRRARAIQELLREQTRARKAHTAALKAKGDRLATLTKTELAVLTMLCQRAGQLVLYSKLSADNNYALKLHIKNLRQKLKGHAVIIKNVRGEGYIIEGDIESVMARLAVQP